MSLSVRTRFEVFKRDRFTCSYCGRTPPNVLLEVDHIIPRAAGGDDDPVNLTTSCQDCNRGKAAGLLLEGTAPVVSRDAIADLEERVAQAQAYAELMQALRGIQTNAYGQVVDAWAKAFGAELEDQDHDGVIWWVFRDGGSFPREPSIRSILRRLPLLDVLEAVDIAADWSGEATGRTIRYFYGVCWRRIDRLEGRAR